MYIFSKMGSKYIWSGDEMKLIISDINLQPHHTFDYVESENDFLYFYYHVAIYTKSSEESEWYLIKEGSVHDFPVLLELKRALDEIRNVKNIDCQRIQYTGTDSIGYTCEFSFDSPLGEDAYSISKLSLYENRSYVRELYSFYAGFKSNSMYGATSVGVRAGVLMRDDVLELSSMLNTLVRDVIEEYNRETRKELSAALGTYHSDDRVLFQKIKHQYKKLYAVGDVIDLSVFSGAISSTNYTVNHYYDVVIKEMSFGHITVSSQHEGDIPLSFDDTSIVNVVRTTPPAHVSSSVIEIAKELDALTPEFTVDKTFCSIEELYEVWHEAIEDRYGLYYSECRITGEADYETDKSDRIQQTVREILSALIQFNVEKIE